MLHDEHTCMADDSYANCSRTISCTVLVGIMTSEVCRTWRVATLVLCGSDLVIKTHSLPFNDMRNRHRHSNSTIQFSRACVVGGR